MEALRDAVDRVGLAALRLRHGSRLRVHGPVSPALCYARMRLEAGARVDVAAGFHTERGRGNELWVQRGARLQFGERVWLRTEHGVNRITAFAGARISIGADALLNGAMLHAKAEISIGSDARLGFGVRILDADFHDLDEHTPERVAPVRLGARVWLGADVLVLRGVVIGDDVVVAAGSVVTRNLPPRCLAAGSPARVLRPIASRVGCR